MVHFSLSSICFSFRLLPFSSPSIPHIPFNKPPFPDMFEWFNSALYLKKSTYYIRKQNTFCNTLDNNMYKEKLFLFFLIVATYMSKHWHILIKRENLWNYANAMISNKHPRRSKRINSLSTSIGTSGWCQRATSGIDRRRILLLTPHNSGGEGW